MVTGHGVVLFCLLLYIERTISFLIGRKRTVNFRNQRLWRHLAADYTIIMSRTLKVTGNHVMTAEHDDDDDDDDEHVITLSSRALCCLPSMKKQKHDHFFFLITPTLTLIILDITKTSSYSRLTNLDDHFLFWTTIVSPLSSCPPKLRKLVAKWRRLPLFSRLNALGMFAKFPPFCGV